MKQVFFLLMLVVCLVQMVAAYGSEEAAITGAATRVLTFLQAIGGTVFGIGLAYTAILLMMHNEDALRKTWRVILGGIILFMVPTIVKLIQGFASGH